MARVVTEAVCAVGDGAHLDGAVRRVGKLARVERHDVVGAAVHEEPGTRRCGWRHRPAAGWRWPGSRPRDRAGTRGPEHARAAPYSRNQPGSRTHVASGAGRKRCDPRMRGSSAALTMASVPPSRKPAIHTPVTSLREQGIDRDTHVGKPTLDREVALGRTGAAERERQTGPTRLARSAIAQRLIGVPDGRRAARSRGSPAARVAPGRRHSRRAGKVRREPESVGKELFHQGMVILTRVTPSTTNASPSAPAPALKEWAAIMHAARGRADRRRPQGRAARTAATSTCRRTGSGCPRPPSISASSS